MCNCQRFQVNKTVKTELRTIVYCVCGHTQSEHDIRLFKETCHGIDLPINLDRTEEFFNKQYPLFMNR